MCNCLTSTCYSFVVLPSISRKSDHCGTPTVQWVIRRGSGLYFPFVRLARNYSFRSFDTLLSLDLSTCYEEVSSLCDLSIWCTTFSHSNRCLWNGPVFWILTQVLYHRSGCLSRNAVRLLCGNEFLWLCLFFSFHTFSVSWRRIISGGETACRSSWNRGLSQQLSLCYHVEEL